MSAEHKSKSWQDLSNEELISDTKRCVAIEREAMLSVIERIREINQRLVHLEMGYRSVHEFCVVELGYSDGAAFRRIQAMELCEDLPVARAAISEGRLSLSNAACLQSYFGKTPGSAKASVEEKERLLSKVEGKSKRQIEKILYPERSACERIELLVDEELGGDLKRLSELLMIPERDHAGLIKKVAKIALKKLDPLQRGTEKLSTSPEKRSSPMAQTATDQTPSSRQRRQRRHRPYIPAKLKRAVWTRDSSQCSFINPGTGKRYSSHYGLQIDHITPLALGGTSTLENLRLLCFAHNHFEAQRLLGRETMARFNPRLRT